MLANILIQNSYRWAEIIAETGESPDADQLTTGLNIFNKLLRKISTDGNEIPLLTNEEINVPQGTEVLTLDGWIKLTKVQYDLGSVRYDVKLLTLNEFLNKSRIQNNSGIMYIGYPLRTPTGIDLQLFFKPSRDYDMFLWGYKILSTVTLATDLSGIELFMQDYLEIQLAVDLQQFYQLKPSPYLVSQVSDYLKKFERLKEKRIDCYGMSLGTGNLFDSLPDLNIGRGYSP